MTGARAVQLILILGPLLLLSGIAELSLLSWSASTIRLVYQLGAALAAVALITAGVRHAQDDVVVIGGLFAGAFLLTRFVDWWWDWMPKYLFFLILAVVALGSLWGLRLARRRLEAAV